MINQVLAGIADRHPGWRLEVQADARVFASAEFEVSWWMRWFGCRPSIRTTLSDLDTALSSQDALIEYARDCGTETEQVLAQLRGRNDDPMAPIPDQIRIQILALSDRPRA